MIADFDDFVTWMYVIVDDLWQPIAQLYRRPGPEPTSCSDSELMTSHGQRMLWLGSGDPPGHTLETPSASVSAPARA